MAENDPPGQRKLPTPPTKRAGSMDKMPASYTLSSDDDNEEKGGQAFDRISRRSRGAQRYGELTQRPIATINGLHTTSASRKTLRRPGRLNKHPINIKSADSVEQSGTLLFQRQPEDKTQEEDDIAEAIARSLRDSEAAEISVKTTPTGDVPPNSTYKRRSYTTLGSDSASNATTPQEALQGVLDFMDQGVEYLVGTAFDGARLGADSIASHLRKWQGIISRIIYMTESAELQRSRDVQVQLDYDRDIEKAHENKIKGLNQAWTAKMHKKELEWQKEMNDLKRIVGAQQRPNEPSTEPHLQCPCFQGEIDLLMKELETLKSDHAAAITKVEASLADGVSCLQRKLKRLAEANAQLHQAHKANDDNRVKKETVEVLRDPKTESCQGNVHMYATRLGPLSSTRESPALPDNGQGSHRVRPESAPCSEDEMSPGKHKLDDGASGAHEGTDWSPKRTKTGSTA